jgi:hypothetical protein
VVLGGLQPEVRGLDAQRRVVRHHPRGRMHRLPERGADDAVVGHVGVEAVLDQECFWTPLISICSVPPSAGSPMANGVRERAARLHAQLLDRAQCGAGRAADVVGRVFRLSSSSITVNGMTMSTPAKPWRQFGSPTSTDVSSTTRVRTPPSTESL